MGHTCATCNVTITARFQTPEAIKRHNRPILWVDGFGRSKVTGLHGHHNEPAKEN